MNVLTEEDTRGKTLRVETSSGPRSNVLVPSFANKTDFFRLMFPGLLAYCKEGTLVPSLLYILTLSNLKEGCLKVIHDLPSAN